MTEFRFEPITICDKRINISDWNVNNVSLLEYLLRPYPIKRIAQIFNELVKDKILILIKPDFEVEMILADEVEDDKVMYLVKWRYWHTEFSTWEHFQNVKHLDNHIKTYEKLKREGNKKLITPSDQSKEELIETILSVTKECYLQPKQVNKYFKKYNPLKRRNEQLTIEQFISDKKENRGKKKTLKKTLQAWEDDINRLYPLYSVIVENNQDDESPPADFKFITDYFSKSVEIHTKPPIGCYCENNCIKNCDSCGHIHTTRKPYTNTGLLLIKTGVPIYECNSACKCNKNCPFRVVQLGVRHEFIIFRTKNRGWGLKTNHKINKGTFIIEYLGEIITGDEAEYRGKFYDQQNLTYLFDLDFAGEPEFTVDAYKMGNLSHFINHSCDPNMTSRCVYIDNLDLRLPRIAFFAARHIKAGEELTFDYQMTGAMDEKDNVKPTDGTVNEESPVGNSENESTSTYSNNISLVNNKDESFDNTSNSTSNQIPRVKCLCKSPNCRKYLY